MRERSVNVSEFRARLREILSAVGSGAIRRLTVTRDGQPLVTVTQAQKRADQPDAISWLLNGPCPPDGGEDTLDQLTRPKLKPRDTGL
jgi:hypothetical protein